MKTAAFYLSLLFLLLNGDGYAVAQFHSSSAPLLNFEKVQELKSESTSQDDASVEQGSVNDKDITLLCEEDEDEDSDIQFVIAKKYKSSAAFCLLPQNPSVFRFRGNCYKSPCYSPGAASPRYILQRTLII